MKNQLLLFTFLLISTLSFSQDTTWVQTFTFDTISSRRSNFTFPPELNTQRFEKVLMYYKLKCDAATPWDQYNCGEWDYLAYTRIFDHTGVYDSVQVDSVRYLNNYQSTPSYSYEPYTGTRTDEYVRTEQTRSGATTTLFPVIASAAGNSTAPFNVSQNGSRYQMLLTSAELISAGITAGDIQSLSLFVPIGGINVNGQLMYPTIAMKPTADNTITDFHTSGFTEVYNLSKVSGAGPEFTVGENELLFYQPFNWNGTDNIIVEFYFESATGGQANTIDFETEISASDMAIAYGDRNGVINFDGTNHALFELSDVDLANDVTITFWAKGLGNTGVNTSILEGYDTLNNRVINIHFPWSNNRLYWDCGKGSGYDRIDKDMSGAGIDNEWHHWAFVKNQGAGEMKVFRDGVLWHSGTGLTRSIGALHRLVIGANSGLGNHWTGKVDEFQLFSAAVDDATIGAWYKMATNASHPNWNDLQVYYNFDNTNYASDQTANNYLLMPSQTGMFDFTETPLLTGTSTDRARISLGQGIVSGAVTNVEVPYYETKEPEVVFEFGQVNHHFEIVNAFLATPEGSEDIYNASNVLISSVPFSGSNVLNNSVITYYQVPFEVVHDVEIGRFITPYGIGFDLGSAGFTWIYDVTDYQMYLHDVVDLAAHNTQELIDLKFAFIEGIPPRDVHKREPIWSEWKSYGYSNLDNDVNLSATQLQLSDSSSMFKIKTRMSGHGQVGNGACCEWQDKAHMISIDGIQRFNWSIWQTTECGDNANTEQGGTWPYAREGWCPGDLVKEYDHDLTPYVTPGATVTFDYDIEDVPANDLEQGAGNYVTAIDLISYSAPNFQRDAAIIDVLNPNKWEYYQKWNPSCSNPRVILQNTGEQALTSCTIRCWISYGDFIEFPWTGNLAFLEKEVVEIPITDMSWWQDYNGVQTFSAQVHGVQGMGADEYPQNDLKEVKFNAPKVVNGPFLTWFTTNNKASENTWRMLDSDGNIIHEQTSFTNSTQYKDTFDLAPGCYSIIIDDSDSDGTGFWYSSQVEGETTGTFRVKLVGGIIVETFPTDFGNYHRFDFSVGFTLGEDEKLLSYEVDVYPNPNNGQFDVELSGNVNNKAELHIYDLMGREVHSQQMTATSNLANAHLELTHLLPGNYIIKVVTGDTVYTKEFIKQ